MKIAICINSFKQERDLQHHERLCVDSLRKLKELYPGTVEIINITFHDEANIIFDGFINLPVLQKSSKSVSQKHFKKLPFLNEIFDQLATLNYDFFIFANNDIAISNRFIREIINNKNYDCFAASKLHFRKLSSVDDTNPDPGAISVHGFDAFAVKPKWWIEKRELFSWFLLGRPYWDTYFFTMCYLHGKCRVLNKPPCVIFHVEHNSDAMTDDELTHFNINSFNQPYYIREVWFRYVYNVLLKRESAHNIQWYVPFQNEEELEKIYLKL